ncbi:MAG TPA: hypothetical protein VGE88_06985 [Lysobacter sp.]
MYVSDSPSGDETDKVDAVTAATESADNTPDANAEATGTSAAVDQGANSELSLDEVIKASLKPAEEAADTPADGKGSEGTESKTDEVEAAGEKTEAEKEAEEDAKVPFHKHPRWQKKLEIERELRAKVSSFEQEVEPLRTKAGQLDEIGKFMATNSLTPDEMAEGMEIMALMKRDPAKALEALRPKLDALEIATGLKFPKDIQDRVDDGKLDEEGARELTRTRFAAKANEERADTATEQLTQTTAQTLHANMKSAVQTWEADLKTRDPDYSQKQSFVIDRTRVLAQANPPKTPEDAVAIAKQAYDDVNKQIRQFAPAKTPTAAVVTSDKSSTRSAPTPKSLEDIVRQSIAR